MKINFTLIKTYTLIYLWRFYYFKNCEDILIEENILITFFSKCLFSKIQQYAKHKEMHYAKDERDIYFAVINFEIISKISKNYN